MTPGRPRWSGVFGMPIVVATLALCGLLAALLLGDDGRRFSWLAVGSPVAIVAWVWLRLRFR
ncbi:hypothetical protein JQ615_37940 [Bradyrhizobium jicamae]|uniref:Uncharacterized protein n=1 Tax=Bradyrhizobium jicamae TaxID=280332 RepID=A0ABS5FWI9_9BRAD|nr:hypothetical protein [Bradyrhizobium jicamae]MBR0801152.1 hypothetical protein [Bradyrhizobium jicamae]MBR0938951.1 hypothetical protein [Bradyrhizobium jicamae]